MAKIIDRLKERLTEEVVTETDIDSIMESEKYYPVESDAEQDDNILKYSNGKSEMWIKFYHADGEYLVTDVTMKTKKIGQNKITALNNRRN